MKETLIGARYLVLEQIGAGGEATVFRARDISTGTEVALRLARQPATHQVAGSLPPFHTSWLQLLDSGHDASGGPYQVFELLDGKTLSQLVERGPLDRQAWFVFIQQSLFAVEALHCAGWVHGDLNAENFFLQNTSPGQWKLLELPFLRFTPPSERSALFGSIHTLAPEQFDGAAASVLSDLYSLGCLYYYAASGGYPHPGATAQEIAVSSLRFAPIPLAEKVPDFPAPWNNWVMTLLAREPQKRFSTAAAAHQLLAVA